MNNIKGYDEFVNEELNFKDVKRFGRRIKIEYSFGKARALLGILKILLFWLKPARNVFREVDIFIDRAHALAKIYNMYDLTNKNVDKMSDEELKNIAEHISKEYAEKYNADLIEDIKMVIKNVMRHPEKIARSVKQQEGLARCRRYLRLLGADGEEGKHVEEDPYNEEEWDDENSNEISFELRDFNGLNDRQILNLVKGQILNKTIIMTPEGESNIGKSWKFKDRFIVNDVIMKEPDQPLGNKKLVFIDPKGRWHIYNPSMFDKNPIKVVK